MRALLGIFFSSVFSFCKIKGCYWWKYTFFRLNVGNPASGLLEIGHKLEKWKWYDMTSDMTSPSNFSRFVSLIKFSYWSKFSYLARMCLMKCYWMLPKARVAAFTVFELLTKYQRGGGVKLPPPSTQIRVIVHDMNENDQKYKWIRSKCIVVDWIARAF